MVQQHPEVFLQAVAIDQEEDSPPASLAVAYTVEAAPFPAPGSSSLVAVPTGNAIYITPSSVPMWQQAKQGAKCCGFCCDYRRAVFILSVIGLCVNMISILFLSVASSLSLAETLAATDDDQDEVLEAELRSNSILFNAFLICMGMLAALCAFVGAWKFNMWLVGINVVWLVGTYHYSHRRNRGLQMMSIFCYLYRAFLFTYLLCCFVECFVTDCTVGFIIETGVMLSDADERRAIPQENEMEFP